MKMTLAGHQQQSTVFMLLNHPRHGHPAFLANRIRDVEWIRHKLSGLRKDLPAERTVHSLDPIGPASSHANRKYVLHPTPEGFIQHGKSPFSRRRRQDVTALVIGKVHRDPLSQGEKDRTWDVFIKLRTFATASRLRLMATRMS
jgi:hypothetical protein